MKILIGTKNPAKIKGAELALKHYYQDFELIGVDVKSNVPEQPINEQTYDGALNRVNNLIKYDKENNINADLFLAIEAGISSQLGRWANLNVAVIKDKFENESFGIGPVFPIPEKYVQDIKNKTLGIVMDELFTGNNLSKSIGGISYLTKNALSRIDITKEAFIMALIQFNNIIWKD